MRGERRPARIEQAEFDLPAVALLAEFVPAHLVLAAIPGDVVLESLQWPMRGSEGEIQEHRTFLPRYFFLHELNRVTRERIARVERLVRGALWCVDVFVAERHPAGMFRVKVTCRSGKTPEELLEAPLQRPAILVIGSEMPFACHERGVSMFTERLRDGDAIAVQIALVGGRPALTMITVV